MPDNSFTLTSAHLFSRERKYFLSRAHTFFLTIKNVGAHSCTVQKAGLRAARQTFAVGLWALRLPGLARRSGELDIVRTADPFRFAAQTLRHKKAPETEVPSAMGRCVGEGRLYRPIQASGLSGDVSRRNWKWSVQLPVPSPATLPSVWRVPTCCPRCTLTLDRLQ